MGKPNEEDGLVLEITELYKRDYERWFSRAKRQAQTEASVGRLGVLQKELEGREEETNQVDRRDGNQHSNHGRTKSKEERRGTGKSGCKRKHYTK